MQIQYIIENDNFFLSSPIPSLPPFGIEAKGNLECVFWSLICFGILFISTANKNINQFESELSDSELPCVFQLSLPLFF